jgi:hypothetical protein
MSSEQRESFGESTLLIHWDDCECSSSSSLPIDCDVFRVGLRKLVGVHALKSATHLDYVRVPCIL